MSHWSHQSPQSHSAAATMKDMALRKLPVGSPVHRVLARDFFQSSGGREAKVRYRCPDRSPRRPRNKAGMSFSFIGSWSDSPIKDSTGGPAAEMPDVLTATACATGTLQFHGRMMVGEESGEAWCYLTSRDVENGVNYLSNGDTCSGLKRDGSDQVK
jgi:hypothetical protein